jgi:hypothetical protein
MIVARRSWGACAKSLAFLLLLSAEASSTLRPKSVGPYFPYDRSFALPPYDGMALKAGVEAEMSFEVHLAGGRVVEVTLAARHCSSNRQWCDEYASLANLWVARTKSALQQWQSYIVTPFNSHVEVVFRLASGMPSNARRFDIEFAVHGDLPSKVVVFGPKVPQ